MSLFYPRQVIADAVGLAYRYAVFVVDFVKRQVGVGSNGADRVPIKFGLMVRASCLPPIVAIGFAAPVSFSNTRSTASFTPAPINRVLHVIGMGAEQQVIGVDARRVVTGVSDKETIWDAPFEQMVGNSMPLMDSQVVDFQFYRSIALGVARFLPNPTAVFRYDVALMKSSDKIFNTHSVISQVGEKFIILENGEEV